MSIFSSLSGGGFPSSLPPSGAAGGDLSGTYPNPSVIDDSHFHTQATLPPIPVTVAKTADEIVNNSTVLQNDNHLVVTLAPGTYRFSFLVHFTDASVTGVAGFKAALFGTATTSNLIAVAVIDGISAVASLVFARFTATGQTIVEAGNAEDKPVLRIDGSVIVTVAGTFGLQWAQQVADATNLTALKGSTLTYGATA